MNLRTLCLLVFLNTSKILGSSCIETLPFEEPFNALTGWFLQPTSEGIRIESEGLNNVLSIDNGSNPRNGNPQEISKCADVTHNTIEFKLKGADFNLDATGQDFMEIEFVGFAGYEVDVGVSFKLFADGKMQIGDAMASNLSDAIPLIGGVWYQFRVEINHSLRQHKVYMWQVGLPETTSALHSFAMIGAPIFLDEIFVQFRRTVANTMKVKVDDITLRNEYSLITSAQNGTIQLSAPPNAFGKYPSGQIVTLTATADQNYLFMGWSGGTNSTDSQITIEMKTDLFLQANFVKLEARTLIVENMDGQGGIQSFIVPNDGGQQAISAVQYPHRKAFLRWDVVAGGNYLTLSSLTSHSAIATLTGGNVTLRAVYDEPKIRVFVRDVLAGSRDILKPEVKIINDSKSFPLTNFDVNFYFSTECFQSPVMDNPTPGSWTNTLIEESQLYKVRYTYSGILQPGDTVVTSTGLSLFYPAFADTCLTCPSYWEKENDWSLDGAGSKFKELIAGGGYDYLVVVDHSGTGISDTIFGRVPPGQEIIVPPAPSIGSDPLFQRLDPPTSPIRQIPNLTSAWAYPLGNFVRNGSFENGKIGWKTISDSVCSGPDFEIGTHGPTPMQSAFDGFHFAQINVCEPQSLQGIVFEIPETDPAFQTLLEGGPVTFSAWVRGGGPGVEIQLVHYEDSNTIFGGGIVDVQGEWRLLQMTVGTGAPYGPPGNRVYRFGVAQGGFFTGPFFVDGVTLVQGYAYIPPQITSTWTNTRHAAMQSRALIPAEPSEYGYNSIEGRVVVSNTEYDSLGRVSRVYLPVSDSCPSHTCNPFFDSTGFFAKVLDSANRRYLPGNVEGLPSADSFAYSQSIYEQDQLTSILKTGRPGRNFQIEDSSLAVDGREHAPLVHFAGVNGPHPGDLGANLARPANTLNPTYAYRHTIDADKNESMEWKNGFDQVVKTAAVLEEGGVKRYVATENLHDDRGNLVKVLPPISCEDRKGSATGLPNCVAPTTYVYDAEGRLIEEFTPDTDTTRMFYDILGQKRITQNAVQRTLNRFTVSVHDELGRVRYSGEYRSSTSLSKDTLQKRAENVSWPDEGDPNFSLFSKSFYDEMPPAVPLELDDYNALFGRNVRLYPEIQAGTFRHTKGRLCAVITYQDIAEAFDSLTLAKVEEYSTTAYRYDKYGRILETFKYNGFILDSLSKLQKVQTQYDISGRVHRTDHYASGEADAVRMEVHYFAYNAQGQLKEIQNNSGKTIAAYSYYPSTGRVKTVELDKFGPNRITVDYAYELSGSIREIRALRHTSGGPVSLYDQDLFYDLLPQDSVAPRRFNGNISHSVYSFSSVLPFSNRVGYTYDNLNRLLEAAYHLDSAGLKMRTDRYSESIRYLDDGRIKSLRRGTKVTQATGGEYHYVPGGNQLAFVGAGMSTSGRDMQGSLASPNFAYDTSGRMVADRSRESQVRYDFRNRPLEFRYTDGDGRRKDVMRYDENGNRISKLSLFASGMAPLDENLVDAEVSRERDYPRLVEAMVDLGGRIGGMTQNPGEVEMHVVPNGEGYVDLSGLNEIAAFDYQGGSAGFEIEGVYPGTAEYYALVAERNQGFTLENAAHYTGLGNEIREEPDTIPGQFTRKLFLDMPQGLGRYSENSPQGLYYLKNHMGTTMATALMGSSGTEDLYDYYPYGVQEKRVASTGDKVTPTFTGKELDEGLGLYYFGARYLDPELGLWISPDAARQYYSPYTYCGNNPIICVDKDGNVGGSAAWDQADQILKKQNLPAQAKAIGLASAGGAVTAVASPFAFSALMSSAGAYSLAHSSYWFLRGGPVAKWIVNNPVKLLLSTMFAGMALEKYDLTDANTLLTGEKTPGYPEPIKFIGYLVKSGFEISRWLNSGPSESTAVMLTHDINIRLLVTESAPVDALSTQQ